MVPQPDPAGNPRLVRHKPDFRRQAEHHLLGVAAPYIKRVVADQRVDVAKRPLHPPIPLLAADLLIRDGTDVLVIGLAGPDRMLAQLQMRCRMAILEQ